jgi:hypothetical protein
VTDVAEGVRNFDREPNPGAEPANDPRTETATEGSEDSDPCAEALRSLNLGDNAIEWMPLGDSTVAVLAMQDDVDQMELWHEVHDAVQPLGWYPVLVDVDMLDLLESLPLPALETHATDERLSVLRAKSFDEAGRLPPETPIAGSFMHRCTEDRFGEAPEADDLDGLDFASEDALDTFLFGWERDRFGDDTVVASADKSGGYWYEAPAEDTVLVVLPVPDGPAAVRLLGFFPTDGRPQWTYALGNDVATWEQAHGARLVANYGTMLQFVVANPPTDLDTAFQLAAEHDVVATATLPPAGIQRRHYAADLIGRTRWHLHDRP